MEKACKKCRREGDKLLLKGERCLGPKCAMVKRPYIPGQHGPNSRTKLSEYGKQLREKQKAKRTYGVGETQLKNYYALADRKQGNTAVNLIDILESRIDNVVFRSGLAVSRSAARQIVSHGHIKMNQRKVTIPSILLKPNDKIVIKERIFKNIESFKLPAWIKADKNDFSITVLRLPLREEADININEKLIIEYYSR